MNHELQQDSDNKREEFTQAVLSLLMRKVEDGTGSSVLWAEIYPKLGEAYALPTLDDDILKAAEGIAAGAPEVRVFDGREGPTQSNWNKLGIALDTDS